MKFLFDYFPIICFFIAFKLWGVFIATAVTMAASTLQVGVFWLKNKRFEKIHIITLLLVLILGGSTLLLHKQIFIQWKPSIIYWLFSGLLFGSQLFNGKPMIARMLSDKINLPENVWKRLNTSWAVFFLLLGLLNIYVVYHYTLNGWVNFKLFGTLGLTFIFVIAQALYMSRYIEKEEK